MIYIGLPQWQHAAWNRIGLRDLADYSRYFNCVEGNTTFYALPKVEIVQRWRDMTGDDFRFCFKFPSDISHKAALRNCAAELQAFYHCLSPVHQRIGQLWLQLPAAFGPDELARMWQFFESLPKEFTYGVEVRHPAFFAKGDAERALNQGLHQRGINRVILDSRPVHHAAPIPPPCVMRSRKNRSCRCMHWSPPTSLWCALSAAISWPTTCAGSKPGSKNCRCGSNSISLICLFIRRTTAIRPSRRKNLAAATPGDPRFACATGLAGTGCTVLTY